MRKKLTLTIDEQVYKALYEAVGPRHISRFIEELIRSCIMFPNREAAYAQMAQDKEREAEALAWAETTGGYFTRSTSLKTLMDELSDKTQERGLTAEELEELLRAG